MVFSLQFFFECPYIYTVLCFVTVIKKCICSSRKFLLIFSNLTFDAVMLFLRWRSPLCPSFVLLMVRKNRKFTIYIIVMIYTVFPRLSWHLRSVNLVWCLDTWNCPDTWIMIFIIKLIIFINILKKSVHKIRLLCVYN